MAASTKAAIARFLQESAPDLVIDAVVVLNAVWVGLEVDMPEAVDGLKDLVRLVILVVYIVEFTIRLAMDPKGLIMEQKLLRCELLCVILAVLGVFVMPDNKVIWRCSCFRIIRGLRIQENAKDSVKLSDLWLALAGMQRAVKSLAWLILIMFLFCFFCGIAVRGLIFNADEDAMLADDLLNECPEKYIGDDFRIRLKCIDEDEYFGNLFKSCVTMLQIATLDRWAAHIMRPLSRIHAEVSWVLMFYVIVMSYGLTSIAVGVLVNSTVEVAKLHDTHRDRVAIVLDKIKVGHLRDYFDKCLALEDRDMLDMREIKEGLGVPMVRAAFEELDLPIEDPNELWTHLDQHSMGEITLDEFEHGCMLLLEPAKRFDMAALSCRLNGRGEFTRHLADRCDATIDEMDRIFSKLNVGFQKCRAHVRSDDINDLFPEVGLRRAGKMAIPHATVE